MCATTLVAAVCLVVVVGVAMYGEAKGIVVQSTGES
jgi:hypothetical protein